MPPFAISSACSATVFRRSKPSAISGSKRVPAYMPDSSAICRSSNGARPVPLSETFGTMTSPLIAIGKAVGERHRRSAAVERGREAIEKSGSVRVRRTARRRDRHAALHAVLRLKVAAREIVRAGERHERHASKSVSRRSTNRSVTSAYVAGRIAIQSCRRRRNGFHQASEKSRFSLTHLM